MVSPGTAVKEPSRAKTGTRSRLSQRMRLPSGYVRSLFLSLAAAFVRMITGQLNRFVFAERLAHSYDDTEVPVCLGLTRIMCVESSSATLHATHAIVEKSMDIMSPAALFKSLSAYRIAPRHTTRNLTPLGPFGCRNRLRLVRRMLALVSFVASSGVSVLSVLITSTSWLFLLGLRLHSLALKEVTGSVHIAVCFLFPYCFQ